MSISIADLAKTGEQIVQNIIDHEGTINMIAGVVGILPQVALAEKALPFIVGALKFIQESTGQSPLDALKTLFDHITPDKPNSPVLSGPQAGADGAPDPQTSTGG